MKVIKLFEKQHDPEIDEKFHQLNIGNIGNVVYWMKFFEMAKEIPGDIVECGIGRARSLIIICALNYLLDKSEGGQREIFGYDSFEKGFPEPTSEDDSPRNPKKGEWSKSPSGKYEYTKDFIQKVLSNSGIPLNEIKLNLIEGFFHESLKNHPQKPVSILHIDGDLYQSYKDTLNFLFDKVSPGGIIIFDDFLAKNEESERFPGAGKAVKEFLKDDYDSLKVSIAGNYYYIKNK